MEKKKVWIFGDSYATSSWNMDVPHMWPLRLGKKYDVTNFALSGTGLEWSINNLFSEIFLCQTENPQNLILSDITVIFYVSEYLGRPNVSFCDPHEQSMLSFIVDKQSIIYKNIKNSIFDLMGKDDLKSEVKRYQKHLEFLKGYFHFIYKHDHDNPLYFSQILLLKHLSGLFNKLLCVPIFHNLNGHNFNHFYGTIEDTNKFMISKGNQTVNAYSSLHPDLPNHLHEINHDIVYDMTVDWIENNAVFDTDKLVKNN